MKLRHPPQHHLILAASLLTTLSSCSPYIPSLEISSSLLLARQQSSSTCPDASQSPCPDSSLPSDFCCPSTSTCLILASNTTLLCCPSGASCSTIQPVVCDVQQQNATTYPNATLKTTNLSATLPTCGDGCCPLGYSCATDGTGNCVLKSDQHAVVTPSAAATSTTASPSTFSTSFPLTTSTSVPSSSNTTSSTQCNAFPPAAIAAGFFPGMALGILASLLAFCFLGNRKRSSLKPAPKTPFVGSHLRSASASTANSKTPGSQQQIQHISPPFIGEPTYTGQGLRTDFLRRQSVSAGGSPPGPISSPLGRVRSLFHRSVSAASHYRPRNRNTNFSSGTENGLANQGAEMAHLPETPRLPHLHHRESTSYEEEIDIFADIRGMSEVGRNNDRDTWERDDARFTRFSDMMSRGKGPGGR